MRASSLWSSLTYSCIATMSDCLLPVFSDSSHKQLNRTGKITCCIQMNSYIHDEMLSQTSAPALCSEALALHFRLGEGSREPNVPEIPRKWGPWMNSWAYWSTGSLCILTFIISVGCWCSWLMGPGAVHPSLHINYWRGVFPVIYLTAGCDKYP